MILVTNYIIIIHSLSQIHYKHTLNPYCTRNPRIRTIQNNIVQSLFSKIPEPASDVENKLETLLQSLIIVRKKGNLKESAGLLQKQCKKIAKELEVEQQLLECSEVAPSPPLVPYPPSLLLSFPSSSST